MPTSHIALAILSSATILGCASMPQAAVPANRWNLVSVEKKGEVDDYKSRIDTAKQLELDASTALTQSEAQLRTATVRAKDARTALDAAIAAAAAPATIAALNASWTTAEQALADAEAAVATARGDSAIASQARTQEEEAFVAWGWDKETEYGSGYDFCARVENATRGKSAESLVGGFIMLSLATLSTASGTVLIAADERLSAPEKGVAVGAPLVGAALYAASYFLFKSSAETAQSAAEAATASSSETSGAAWGACNKVVAQWNNARANTALEAAERARESEEGLRRTQDQMVRKWFEEQLQKRLSVTVDADTGS